MHCEILNRTGKFDGNDAALRHNSLSEEAGAVLQTDHDVTAFPVFLLQSSISERGSVVSVRMIYFKQIGFTHEACSPEGFGIPVDFRRFPVLYQHPPVHQEHSFRKSDRFIRSGDQQRSNPLLTKKVPDITYNFTRSW